MGFGDRKNGSMVEFMVKLSHSQHRLPASFAKGNPFPMLVRDVLAVTQRKKVKSPPSTSGLYFSPSAIVTACPRLAKREPITT